MVNRSRPTPLEFLATMPTLGSIRGSQNPVRSWAQSRRETGLDKPSCNAQA